MVLLSTKNTSHKNVHMTGLLICTPSQCYLTYYLRVIRHVSQVFWYPSTNCFECQNSYLCPKELNQYNKFEGLFCPPAKETFSLLTGMGFQMRWQQCLFVKNFRLIEMGLMTDFSLSEKRASTLRLCPSTKPVLLVQVPLCKRAPQTNLSMQLYIETEHMCTLIPCLLHLRVYSGRG